MTTVPDSPESPHGGLAEEVRRLLAGHLHPRRFASGALLWREGETSGMLVALTSGRVKIYRLLPTGRSVTLYIFGPDDVFGFLPLIDGQPYPAYAQAIDDVTAEVIARPTLLRVLRTEPDLALMLIELLGRRLREAFDQLQSRSTPGVRARVATALIPLIPDSTAAGEPIPIKLPVSAHEFAGAIGVAPETLSRALAALVAEGVLERAGTGRYLVADRSALERAIVPPLD